MAGTSTAALLQALRQASTAPAASNTVDQAVDRLISTISLAEAQNLVFGASILGIHCGCYLTTDGVYMCIGLQQYQQTAGISDVLYGKLQLAAAICTEPRSKAEFLGFALLQEIFHQMKTLEVSTVRQKLLKIFNANKSVLSGYLGAIAAADGPIFSSSMDQTTARKVLEVLSPVFKAVLADNQESEGHKAAVLNAMSSIYWQFSEDAAFLRTTTVRVLVEALELVPHAQFSQSAYVCHVTLVIDMLSSFMDPTNEQMELASRTARFVLESTQILIDRDEGAVRLLQSLGRLAQCVPEALWSSEFLASAAYFLVDKCKSPLEQQLMLNVLESTLEFGAVVSNGERGVYVEILLLPLASFLSVHGNMVPKLLQKVIRIKSACNFHLLYETQRNVPATETAAHARSAVRMIGDEEVCQLWLSSLFSSKDTDYSDGTSFSNSWFAILLAALLSDERPSLRGCAAKCLERQVDSSAKFWGSDITKSLVASLLFLVSQQPANSKAAPTRLFGEWMASCLYSLARLAATTTDTMRIMLRLIDSMNSTTNMRPMALKLMYEVWRTESRVFPRLETMLLEATSSEEEVEYHVVRVATVQALCEKHPEVGVQFISPIQGFLEDELVSVVSMAMDAIASLCRGDCLDFYVAFKIIAQKIRKNKVLCADEPLFQERLCCFYALGGAESAENEKNATKLLNQTWEFADSDHSNVRRAAYAAMCKFPVEMLGLCMPAKEEDDEEQMTEEEVEEQLDDLMQRLENEHDSEVRIEIGNLVAAVIELESKRITAGVGRGQRMASAASGLQTGSDMVISAAATKEMKALLPSRAEAQADFPTTTDFSGFLLAYQPKAVIDVKNARRKDKLVRLATQNVDELVETVTTVLQSMELPWASSASDDSCSIFLRSQALMGGWRGIMATYKSSLEELAELKVPVVTDDADVAFRVFSDGVAGLLDLLLHTTSNKIGGAVAAGALAGQLCESRHWQNPQLHLQYEETIEELSRRLALSIEQTRVFSNMDSDARISSVGAVAALQLGFAQRKVDASENNSRFCAQLEKIVHMFTGLIDSATDDLLPAFALLGLSQVGALYSNAEDLETFQVTQWRQQQVKPIAEHVLGGFLYPDKQQIKPLSSFGELVFPLTKSADGNTCVESVWRAVEQTSSSSGLLLRWASLMGLAQLASGFPSIKRLDWLVTMRRVLAGVWEAHDFAAVAAVALGPVLLQCVHLNVEPSSCLEKFVATSIHRAAETGADSLDGGFLMLAAAYVLCRVDSFGGFPSTTQNQTRLAVEQLQRMLEGDNSAVRLLALSSIVNFFHLGYGISGSFALANLNGDVELLLDVDAIAKLVELTRAQTQHQCDLSHGILAAIARAADSFYVSHKKQSFDVELRTLPAKSLLVKALEWLRQTNPSSGSTVDSTLSETVPEPQTAVSLLRSLSSIGSVLPLLNYQSLIHRVMLRFCSVDVTVACVQFAGTQGSCDELLARELLSSKWFSNAGPVLQAKLVVWISQAATRVPTDVLRILLSTTFTILKDIWRHDTSSAGSILLFDNWTAMLHDIMETKSTRRIPDGSLEMVNRLILEEIVLKLPFGPEATVFVEQFASRVLAYVNFGERNPSDVFLLPSSNDTTWSWWTSGVFVVELAKLNVLTVTKREASLVFQWLLRHDFKEWTDITLVAEYLQPLIAKTGALVAQHLRPDETASSLLDVLDGFYQRISLLDSSVHSDIIKLRGLFHVTACVLSWKSSLMHEQFLAKTPGSDTANVDLVCELLPFGLIASKSVPALGERLFALQQQLTSMMPEETEEYIATLRMAIHQMYVATDKSNMTSSIVGEIRDTWSL
ncbi:Protein RST1 [Phytophthora citrophthora]|uniref:Protein RST1 n=1 Tax=Phytophthora citrophthora TaxID=4793 RepID=A0AAD9G0K2_9STRA|nr:Protein RST1 [Phytophthora citrophthora]